MQKAKPSEKRYIITFIDDISHFIIIKLLANKSWVQKNNQNVRGDDENDTQEDTSSRNISKPRRSGHSW